MKINRLETHDRLKHFQTDQALNISKGVEDCLKRNQLSLDMQDRSNYVYIFAHPRTAEDGVTKRMLYQPRLTKPLAQTNSYLFRAISKTDTLEVCWLLPPFEMWSQYRKGNVTESEIVMWSILQFQTNKAALEQPNDEDLPDDVVRNIYLEIARTKDLIENG